MKIIKTLGNYRDELSNQIAVGKGAKASSGVVLNFTESRASIVVGENSNLTDSEIMLGKGSKLTIGSNCILKGRFSIGSFSSIEIGCGLSVTNSLYVRVVEATKVTIGDDCLIATGVIIRTNDGHPIYDTKTGERLNKSRDVVIGNHVWLGDESVILKGVTIGDGSIVAMRSVVTRDVESKTIVAGIPAQVIRKDCVWEHDLKTRTERFYES